MTRYRQSTRKFLILYLTDALSAPLSQIAKDLDKEPRVVRNYLRHFDEDFEVVGKRWVTTSRVVRGRIVPR